LSRPLVALLEALRFELPLPVAFLVPGFEALALVVLDFDAAFFALPLAFDLVDLPALDVFDFDLAFDLLLVPFDLPAAFLYAL
jgi:hypothetical protein